MNDRMDRREPLAIPLNVAEWVDGDLLSQWAVEEVESLDWNNPLLLEYLNKHPDFRPKALLTMLIYAYMTGLLESEEIVANLMGKSELRRFWQGPPPTRSEIGRFRRENRALLKWGIVQVLKRVVQHKLQLGDVRFLAGLRQALVESAVERLDLARHMDRAAQGA